MEQTSFFSSTGTAIMPSAKEFGNVSGVSIDNAIEAVADELSAYFRRHASHREVLSMVLAPHTRDKVMDCARARFNTDPEFRLECGKRGGQRYATGFVRTWIAAALRADLEHVHRLLPIGFRATGLAIPQGCLAPD